jgi:hypothetical protein
MPPIEAHAPIVRTSHDDGGAVRAVADGHGDVTKSDGLAYLNALRELSHGDYFWATDPFEMDLDEAPASDPPAG